MWRFNKDLSQRLFLIDDYVFFAVGGGGAILAFVADVAAVAFHLATVVLALFIVAAVASDFKSDYGDSAVAWYFLEIFDN